VADRPERFEQQPAAPESRQPNIAGLFWSMIFTVVAVVGFTGSFGWIFENVTRWIAAAVVALIGLGLLITALPRRSGS
jgi:hypothetical protein